MVDLLIALFSSLQFLSIFLFHVVFITKNLDIFLSLIKLSINSDLEIIMDILS